MIYTDLFVLRDDLARAAPSQSLSADDRHLVRRALYAFLLGLLAQWERSGYAQDATVLRNDIDAVESLLKRLQ